jgi:hypothetical protein
MARVPVISNEVLSLCRRIHPFNQPGYVEVRPGLNAKALDCFMNVETKVKAEGGAIRYGWALWQPSGFFLAAEHHAVYEPKSGPPWVDITPHRSDVTRILFLPDEKAFYDMNTDERRDNIRMAVVDDARAGDLFRLYGEYNDILNSVAGFGRVPLTGAPAQRVLEIERRSELLKAELDKAYPLPKLGRNDLCFCGSGKKYKKCHEGH